jgi:hypothetical protein
MPSELMPEWLKRFEGNKLEDALDLGAIFASVDEEGWPHHAYLSAGEILVHSGEVSVALWGASRAVANVMRAGRAVVYVAAQGSIWEARLTLKRRPADNTNLAVFDGSIIVTRQHSAPYADVISLLDFKLHDRQSTLQRWREQIELLRGGRFPLSEKSP